MKTKNDATMKRKHRKETAQSNVVSLNLNMNHELMARHQVRGPVSCCFSPSSLASWTIWFVFSMPTQCAIEAPIALVTQFRL
jgi:hypothetical protein